MRLVFKTGMIVGTAVVGLLGMNAAALHTTVMPTFSQLEMQAAQTNAERVLAAFGNEQTHLQTVASDWGVWDQSYGYMQGDNPDWLDQNLYYDAFVSMDNEAAYLVRADGEVAYAGVYDLESGQSQSVDALPADRFPATHPLLQPVASGGAVGGWLMSNLGPLMLASQAILKSDGTGPSPGAIIMGRVINDKRIEQIKEQTKVDFTLERYDEAAWEKAGADAVTRLPDGTVIDARSDHELQSHSLVRDMFGKPILIVSAVTAREITALGRHTVIVATSLVALIAVIAFLIVGVGLQHIAVRPLQRLAGVIREIGKSGDLSRQTGFQTADEFGDVSRAFDAMIVDLRKAREQLLEQSYYSGMSELAVTSLHSVRNALNPLSIGIWQMQKLLESCFAATNVERAAAELADPAVASDRKAKLAAFTADVARRLVAERQKLAASLQDLNGHIGSLEGVLTEIHAPHATTAQLETVDLAVLLDELLLPSLRAKYPALQIGRSSAMPSVRAERTVLLQILNNLAANAAESIAAAGQPSGRIDFAATEAMASGQAMVRISIVDNGEGFADDLRTKMFQRGFSTRKSKAGGLGLHWCANGVAAFGGRIVAESAGLGRGATFHLLLPPPATDGKQTRDAA